MLDAKIALRGHAVPNRRGPRRFSERGSVSRGTMRAIDALDLSKRWAADKAPAGHRPVVFGRRFALSAQPYFLSLSFSKKEERAGERRHLLSISPLSGSLPARSSQGERGKYRRCFACRTKLITAPRSI